MSATTDRLRELEKAATPGPWEWSPGDTESESRWDENDNEIAEPDRQVGAAT